ncbi:MAG: hypothetical protein KAH01_05425 [Caldisericia bacterium]|nr:hypothetical protein [Caldisericia bacterium]
MGNSNKITNDILKSICRMSSLSLTEDEQADIIEQLNSIASLFDEVNTSPDGIDDLRTENYLSPDKPKLFQNVKGLMKNVPVKEENLVVCPVMSFKGKQK